MKITAWFEREFDFGFPAGMLPFYLERLEGTIARLEKKVGGVSEVFLSNKVEGKWSIKQNIGHLAEVDEVALKRIDEIRNGVSSMAPAVFEPRKDYNAQPIAEVLGYFIENRTKNLVRYKSLTQADLHKSALHPRLKVLMNLVDLAWFDAEHDDHHLVRINEILHSLSK
jgi:hypothetical protein